MRLILAILFLLFQVFTALPGCSVASNANQGVKDSTTSSSDTIVGSDIQLADSVAAEDQPTEDLNISYDYQSTPDTTGTGLPTKHEPIRIVLPVRFDKVGVNLDPWIKQKENLKWLYEYVKSRKGGHQPRLSIQLNGEQAMIYLGKKPQGMQIDNSVFESQVKDGAALLKELVSKDHELGSDIPPTVLNELKQVWTELKPTGALLPDPCLSNQQELADPAPAELLLNWNSHLVRIDQLVAELQKSDRDSQPPSRVVHATYPQKVESRYLMLTGQMSFAELQLEHGFEIESFGRTNCFVSLFGHGPWNPWRGSTDQLLVDDPTNKEFIVVPHHGPLGRVDNTPYNDGSLSARQRMFVQQVIERNYHMQSGLPPRIWVYGWQVQLNDLTPTGTETSQNRREIQKAMIEWLNTHFVDEPHVEDVSVARYSTFSQVKQAFDGWKKNHQKTFTYDLQFANYGADTSIYPYELVGLAKELSNGHFVEFLQQLPGSVHGARFEICPTSLREETQCYWRQLAKPGELGCFKQESPSDPKRPDLGARCPTRQLLVLWSSGGKQVVDLTKTQLGIEADSARNGRTGEPLASPITAMPIAADPVLLSLEKSE